MMENEKSIAAFWKEHHIFERSVQERPKDKPFSFFDGPPFATGLPHYGHIVASTIKDVIPRYATMRGYRVERRWGWDCHGLPVENLIEQELGLKTKQDIEAIGVAKFNDACQASVLKYTQDWKATIERLGRWVDMSHDYRTMDPDYMESVWWVFKTLYERGLIYEGKKAMHVCPRCVTPLSNFEVTLGYKDITDISAYVKFQVTGKDFSLLAWTTTPWTLPGNVLLAVNPTETYVVVNTPAGQVVLAQTLLDTVLPGAAVTAKLSGQELVGLTYEPLFPYYRDTPNGFRVVAAEFVTTLEGTGIVHIAPGYGEDDYQLGQAAGVEIIQPVQMTGEFVEAVTDFSGQQAKPKADPTQTDRKIVAWLQAHGKLLLAKDYTHSYPHCWRCDTPLLNYATSSWFVRVSQLKADMLKHNDQVTWIPEHVKYGRFGKWLEGAKDWAISRERYWGAPLPIWKSKDGEILCVGSIAELAQLSGVTVTDLHKQFVDKLVITKDGKSYQRIGAVLDCWFESGAMPYAQNHWQGGAGPSDLPPGFPADFIAEGLDQTRGWFYTLMVLSTALYQQPAFRHVLVNGLVLAEDGKKMSKRLKNYPEPNLVLDKYGADALRFYLLSSPVVKGEDLRFSEKGVDLVMKKVMLTLWNVVSFYQMFAEGKTVATELQPNHVMDQWILGYTQQVIQTVTEAMDHYDINLATASLQQFVQQTSTWYLRRSRARFKDPQTAPAVLAILRYVLDVMAKLLAPFTPFMAERIYQQLYSEAVTSGDSIHLQAWPTVQPAYVADDTLAAMAKMRAWVELILGLREQHSLKVRQPLSQVTLPETLPSDYEQILLEEVNIKAVVQGEQLSIDTQLTPALKTEGKLRELTRNLNALRKKQKLTIQDKTLLTIQSQHADIKDFFTEHQAQLQTSVLASDIIFVEPVQEHSMKLDGSDFTAKFGS